MGLKIQSSPGNENQLPSGCIRLFGLPFFLAGLGMLAFGFSMFYTWHQSANWEKAKGRVISARIKSHRGSKSTTYRIDGSYEFSYKGQLYKSKRFTIESGSNSAYKEKQKKLKFLEHAMRTNTPIDVYVNPKDPNKSFVFREISMTMVMLVGMGLCFAMVGFALVGGWMGKLTASGKKAADGNNSPGDDEPWASDPRWNGFVIKTNNRGNLLGAWVLAAFFTLFIGTFIAILVMDEGAPLFAWIVIMIFALIALAIDIAAVYSTIQYLKFRESSLVIGQFPLVPGGEFTGVMAVLARFSPGQTFDFEVICERKTVTGSGKSQKTDIDKLYDKKFSVAAESHNFNRNHMFIPLKLQVPDNAEITTPASDNPSLTWKLKATASVPGVDFAAEFPLPVYNVSSPDQIKYKAESESI